MNELKEEDYSGSADKTLGDYTIPGLKTLADKIAAASNKGTLFFLAEEIDLLLIDCIKKKGALPTSVELEAIILQAAQKVASK
ncbi:MAG: hypothetical protein KJ077_14825 [Anaerolineae bacterium]|nr:hypothetical protein [Anaerolineae bacterium]